MKSYNEERGNEPDFEIEYSWVSEVQRPFQHMRSDFRYPETFNDEGIWMIWPEFIDNDGNVILNFETLPESGRATMWILVREEKYLKMHRERLKVGLVGELVVGSRVLARAKVTKILGLKNET